MPNRLVIAPDDYSRIHSHLFQDWKEQVAFVFARTVEDHEGITFETSEVRVLPPEDFDFQSDYHVSLTDEAQARIIKDAWDRQAALVEIHSHTNPRFPAKFSPSDLAGFEEFVPHVWWRLKGKPYLAVVISPGSLDALVWRVAPNAPERLTCLQIGDETRMPTGLTLDELRGQHGRDALQPATSSLWSRGSGRHREDQGGNCRTRRPG